MIILDTDIVSLLDRREGDAYENIVARLAHPDASEVCTTIVTFEEQLRGWLTTIASARSPVQQVRAYGRLHRLLRAYQLRPVIDFDDAAVKRFAELRRTVRIGTMDLRIASIALTHGALLVTRNLVDFRQVPELQVEDWSISP